MCSVIEVWQADGLADVFLSSASGVLENASIGRGWGSGFLFEAKAAHDCTINAAIANPMGNEIISGPPDSFLQNKEARLHN